MKTRWIVVIIAMLMLCAYGSAQPDNCCGIDRQCTTDQEWSDGYWAYQNNACVAPAQSPSQPQSPVPSTTTTASNIDNCCFVDRQCTTDAEWANGYRAFQNNQCSVTEEHGGAVMSGGQRFYEFLGAETLTTDTALLTRGTWDLTLITAAGALVNIGSVDVPGCLNHSVSSVYGLAIGFRQALAWKTHNIFGGNNEANGRITVHRDCNVSFYVWAPRHTWSLKLRKI